MEWDGNGSGRGRGSACRAETSAKKKLKPSGKVVGIACCFLRSGAFRDIFGLSFFGVIFFGDSFVPFAFFLLFFLFFPAWSGLVLLIVELLNGGRTIHYCNYGNVSIWGGAKAQVE